MAPQKDAAKNGPLIYLLGRWSKAYMAEKASKITNFFCWKCKKQIHGISMYEHWSLCSPVFFKGIKKPKDKQLEQQYTLMLRDGSVEKGTRKVEVGYVEQGGRSGFDPNGISPELQGEVVLSKPGEDRGPLFENSRSEDVKQEPEPVSKVIRGIQDHIENKEAL